MQELIHRIPKLGLGTVQMGMDYGITNTDGKIPPERACEIINIAMQNDIEILDTAHAYGNSEDVLGECLGKKKDKIVKIITKTPISLKRISEEDMSAYIKNALNKSLKRIGRESIYGYLVHHAKDLLSDRGESIWQEMLRLRDAGLVRKIGFSAYTAEEIDAVLDKLQPDLVQLPMNALDRRLMQTGTIFRLRDAGVEVHARSLFLQGILLQPPQWFRGFFAPLARPVSILDETSRALGITRMALLLGLVWQMGMADYLIVGVTNKHQLMELLQAREQAISMPAVNLPDEAYKINEQLLNPTQWPK